MVITSGQPQHTHIVTYIYYSMNRQLEDEMCTKYEHAVNASEGKRAKTKTRISF